MIEKYVCLFNWKSGPFPQVIVIKWKHCHQSCHKTFLNQDCSSEEHAHFPRGDQWKWYKESFKKF